jgi:Phage integrase family
VTLLDGLGLMMLPAQTLETARMQAGAALGARDAVIDDGRGPSADDAERVGASVLIACRLPSAAPVEGGLAGESWTYLAHPDEPVGLRPCRVQPTRPQMQARLLPDLPRWRRQWAWSGTESSRHSMHLIDVSPRESLPAAATLQSRCGTGKTAPSPRRFRSALRRSRCTSGLRDVDGYGNRSTRSCYSSLRFSELVALRVDRLELPRNRIRVEEKITAAGHLIAGTPKTERSRRTVTLPEFVTYALSEHLRRYPPGPGGLVFTAPEGGPVRRQSIYHRGLGARAYGGRDLGGSGSGSYATRATMALEAGANPVLVAFRLGHTSTRMVEQHYAGRLDRADKEIAEALDARHGAARVQHAEGFPAPVQRDGRGRLWDQREVKAWAKEWRPEKPWR